jgi:phosphoglycerate kinase
VVAPASASGGALAEDPVVIESLVRSHDLFVNDSFQWAYLPLPSLLLPPSSLPSAVGRTLQRDLEAIVPILRSPERPFTAVLGGDRSYLRLHGMQGLVLRADTVLVGGAMALPLLQASGRQPVDGVYDDFLAECRAVCGLAQRVAHRIYLPVDLVWSRPDGTVEVVPAGERPGGQVVDIGPLTRRRFAEIIEGAGLVLWTGALGQVEDERFAAGTYDVATALGASGCVVGGDALMSMLAASGLLPPRARVVSATDSALELLKNGDLPALIALRSSTQAN